MEIADDGEGGADPGGAGLTGLRQRVEALDGRLAVQSGDAGDHDPGGAAVRIVIAEDLTLLREGLTRLLRDRGWEIVAAVDTGPALVDAIVEHRPDLALVDVRLPPSFTDEGVRAAIEARERVPGTPVLILSQYVEESYAGDLLASDEGGVGYLLKDRVADVRQFTESLQRVAGGGTAMDPEVVAQLLGRRDNRGPLGELTPRELEVLTLMAEGRSNTGIGIELGISASAIEKHVKQVFMKLDLPPSDSDHRRVLAVLKFLAASPLAAALPSRPASTRARHRPDTARPVRRRARA